MRENDCGCVRQVAAESRVVARMCVMPLKEADVMEIKHTLPKRQPGMEQRCNNLHAVAGPHMPGITSWHILHPQALGEEGR